MNNCDLTSNDVLPYWQPNCYRDATVVCLWNRDLRCSWQLTTEQTPLAQRRDTRQEFATRCRSPRVRDDPSSWSVLDNRSRRAASARQQQRKHKNFLLYSQKKSKCTSLTEMFKTHITKKFSFCKTPDTPKMENKQQVRIKMRLWLFHTYARFSALCMSCDSLDIFKTGEYTGISLHTEYAKKATKQGKNCQTYVKGKIVHVMMCPRWI